MQDVERKDPPAVVKRLMSNDPSVPAIHQHPTQTHSTPRLLQMHLMFEVNEAKLFMGVNGWLADRMSQNSGSTFKNGSAIIELEKSRTSIYQCENVQSALG